jgi:hypothetical protein
MEMQTTKVSLAFQGIVYERCKKRFDALDTLHKKLMYLKQSLLADNTRIASCVCRVSWVYGFFATNTNI